MPLPWKKMKSARISQLVNDHLHKSQKRRDGSSLVVETGFPTSLVDLFIKNREKLKKPSKRKSQSPPISPTIGDLNDPLIAGSNSPLPSPMISPLITVSPLRSPLVSTLPSEGVIEKLAVGLGDGNENECVGERGVDANMVIFVVLKVFLVVVLALGTKRLTVGITLSAFLLFLIDYLGKHACVLLKPCSEAKRVLKSTVQTVWGLLRFKVAKFDDKKNDEILMPKVHHDQDQEIEIVELNRYYVSRVDEIQPENEVMDLRGRLEYQEIESKDVLIEEKEESVCDVAELKRKSRRAKLKSKMKKLVPKKLRCSRKEQDTQRLESAKEDNSAFLFDEQPQVEEENESECVSELSSLSSRRYREDDEISVICASGGLSDVIEEMGTKMEEKKEEIVDGQTWRNLVLCLIIVLVGLVGGRAFALLLTLSWCLLLKLGDKLPSYMKVSIIKSS